uniref:Uncharacterized protein n=1 Tax=Cannabis sativa TaxID=3483 RepID=A0A803PHJ2_CANSA
MGFQVNLASLVACLALCFLVAAAHEGHNHTPGMDMTPSPQPHDHGANHGSIAYPSFMVGVFALAFPFLAFWQRA